MIELWRWEMQPERFTSSGHPAGTFELLHVNEGILTLTVDETVTQVAAGASAVAKRKPRTAMPMRKKGAALYHDGGGVSPIKSSPVALRLPGWCVG